MASTRVECVAAITYSVAGSTYTQNFNSSTLEADNMDDDVTFTNDSTITGWHLFTVTSGSDATPVAAGNYDTHTGGATAASFYSFGTPDGDPERALGGIGGGNFYSATSIASGAIAGWIAANINNATGATLSEFTLSFDGEQWRRGSDDTANTMVFEYGFGSTFTSVSTWTAPGGNFNWTNQSSAQVIQIRLMEMWRASFPGGAGRSLDSIGRIVLRFGFVGWRRTMLAVTTGWPSMRFHFPPSLNHGPCYSAAWFAA